MKVIKKKGQEEFWNNDKLLKAVRKSSKRAGTKLSEEQEKFLISKVKEEVYSGISVTDLHLVVEKCLTEIDADAGKAYKDYRNYKQDFVTIWDEVYNKTKDVMYRGDRENANFLSTLTSTKGSLIRGYVTKELYQRFNLTPEELEATEKGYIYIHDMKDMIFGSINCIDENGWVKIRHNGVITDMQLKGLKEYLNAGVGVTPVSAGIQILSRHGWVALQGISVRPLGEIEAVYEIKTRNGLSVNATEKHRIPVITVDGVEVVKEVSDILNTDSLISNNNNTDTNKEVLNLLDYLKDKDKFYVGGIKKLKSYVSYKYGKTLNEIFRVNDIKMPREIKSLSVRNFEKLCDIIEIPYDLYNNFTVYAIGSSAKLPLLLNNSRELARIIGYVLADGCVSKSGKGCYQVQYSSITEDYLQDYLHCVGVVFPDVNAVFARPSAKSTTPCSSVTMCNAVINEFFSNFKRGANDITIPTFITCGEDDLKYNFIGAALDCDGCWSESCVSYTTVCKSYAEQVFSMYKSLGIEPTMEVRSSAGQQMVIKGVSTKRNYDTNIVKVHRTADINLLKVESTSFKGKYYKLKDKKGVTTFADRITKITKKYGTCEYVYDLETADNWFVVNGYVVHNCCLFDMSTVLKDGFEMSNLKYSEPTSALSALQVIGDVILSASSQEFGGFTVPQIDEVILPYCIKTLEQAEKDALLWGITDVESYKNTTLQKELKQGFQSLEMKLNSIPSSRGDFAFTTFSFGALVTNKPELRGIQKIVCETMLKVRMKGQGKGEPVVFPKYVFLFSQEQHSKYKDYQNLVDLGIECSSKALYPDWLCYDGKGSVGDIYKESGEIVSPMGCRAYLSDFKGDDGKTVITGRANIGAVAMNLPMIWKKSNGKTFYKDIDKYLQMIREFHLKRYDQIANTPCSSNPVAFTQGGLYKGNKELTDKIGYDIVESFTASFGVTALNELNVLMEGKPLHESDRVIINEVVDYLVKKVEQFSKDDKRLYKWYGVPAESLSSTQLNQFKKEFGVIEGVSDKEYFSNSFHAHVSADITPFEKQDIEEELFHKIEGGHIQYTRFNNHNNVDAIKSTVLRGMSKGFYSGVNFDLVICENCGHRPDKEPEHCPKCGSDKIMVQSRACGYISYKRVGGDTRFNEGKLAEIRDRVSM